MDESKQKKRWKCHVQLEFKFFQSTELSLMKDSRFQIQNSGIPGHRLYSFITKLQQQTYQPQSKKITFAHPNQLFKTLQPNNTISSLKMLPRNLSNSIVIEKKN
jgi:hypothetical protein